MKVTQHMVDDYRVKLEDCELENEALKEFLDKLHHELDQQHEDMKELTLQFFKLKEVVFILCTECRRNI